MSEQGEARIEQLRQLVHWMAQTVHRAHHLDPHNRERVWQECSRGFCASVRSILGAIGVGVRDAVPRHLSARIAELEAEVDRLRTEDMEPEIVPRVRRAGGPAEAS
jgi:hypothetical protein